MWPSCGPCHNCIGRCCITICLTVSVEQKPHHWFPQSGTSAASSALSAVGYIPIPEQHQMRGAWACQCQTTLQQPAVNDPSDHEATWPPLLAFNTKDSLSALTKLFHFRPLYLTHLLRHGGQPTL
jgi:hypothetical protein